MPSLSALTLAMKWYASAKAESDGIHTLYRGITSKVAGKIKEEMEKDPTAEFKIPVNSLSSWSSSKSEARGFAGYNGVILKLKVDPDNIWASYKATPFLFKGYLDEQEYIVGHHQPFEKFKKADIEVV